eukprot:COSAG02_NODE_8076_length_2720_cov_1.879435_1_plen_748_part_10
MPNQTSTFSIAPHHPAKQPNNSIGQTDRQIDRSIDSKRARTLRAYQTLTCPHRAADGDGDTAAQNFNWMDGWVSSCPLTDQANGQPPAWFQVDLGIMASISWIGIYHLDHNLGGVSPTWISGAQAFVSSSTDYVSTGTVCGTIVGSNSGDENQHVFGRDAPEVISCNDMSGQFVTIMAQPGTMGATWLSFCELEVWGTIGCSVCPAGKRSSVGSTECTPCADGTFSAPGSASCHTCVAGEVEVDLQCRACEAGKYDHDSQSSTACVVCPAGTYQPEAGAVAHDGRYEQASCIPIAGALCAAVDTSTADGGQSECSNILGCEHFSAMLHDAGSTEACVPSDPTATQAVYDACAAADLVTGDVVAHRATCTTAETPAFTPACAFVTTESSTVCPIGCTVTLAETPTCTFADATAFTGCPAGCTHIRTVGAEECSGVATEIPATCTSEAAEVAAGTECSYVATLELCRPKTGAVDCISDPLSPFADHEDCCTTKATERDCGVSVPGSTQLVDPTRCEWTSVHAIEEEFNACVATDTDACAAATGSDGVHQADGIAGDADERAACQQAGSCDYIVADSQICQACPAGTFSGSGSVVCAACAQGMYDNDRNATTPCIRCPAGQSAVHEGMTECAACQAGTFAENGVCTNCEPGTYDNDESPGTPCIQCPAGTVTSEPRQTTCAECPSSREPVGDQTSCHCLVGSFPSTVGGDCVSCPAGQSTSLSGRYDTDDTGPVWSVWKTPNRPNTEINSC